MPVPFEATADDREWLASQFDALTTELVVRTPSEWAEERRYLPQQAAQLPGPFRFDVTPYLREIVDCLGPDSPIREVAFMKGVQLGATVGVLENYIGFIVEHVKTAPVMMVTADAELAKLRIETSVIPMLQLSGLDHLIKSSDEKNPRKTGRTDKKLEWVGGGFLIPTGAINPSKMRSIPIQLMLRDEIDGWPDQVGKDGDPLKLSFDRTATYELSRKVLDISTPLLRDRSKIERQFLRGDQRRYFVCCLKCGRAQVLRWERTDPSTGYVSGIQYDLDAHGRLVPNSTRYVCENADCGHAHVNDDKTRLLAPEHGAEWRATATPVAAHVRSYHLSALYSPVGMQSWDACVQKWLEAWDVERNTVRSVPALQVFYNNVLGETFKVIGDKVSTENVSAHRRSEYQSGEIPNQFALSYCGSRILVLICTVDVHADNLAVGVFGWTRDRRCFVISYDRFEGDTSNLDDEATWGRLRKLIEEREYTADDGNKYRLSLTLIDSGYRADDVYRFCSEYASGVYPVKGRADSPKAAATKEFSPFTTPMGTTGYGVTVDLYKDRWGPALKRSWNGIGQQPAGHFNAPKDITDRQLRELTVEVKRQRRDSTGLVIGFEWYRPSGADNELWDTLIYATAGLDMLARDVCISQLGGDSVVWTQFFDLCEQQRLFMV